MPLYPKAKGRPWEVFPAGSGDSRAFSPPVLSHVTLQRAACPQRPQSPSGRSRCWVGDLAEQQFAGLLEP